MTLLLALFLALPSSASDLLTLEKAQTRLSSVATAAPRLLHECGGMGKPVAFKYCIDRTEGSKSTAVLYYLHGLGGNQKSWTEKDNFPSVMRKLWAAQGKDVPAVVTVSF